jgi:hypothetical protein
MTDSALIGSIVSDRRRDSSPARTLCIARQRGSDRGDRRSTQYRLRARAGQPPEQRQILHWHSHSTRRPKDELYRIEHNACARLDSALLAEPCIVHLWSANVNPSIQHKRHGRHAEWVGGENALWIAISYDSNIEARIRESRGPTMRVWGARRTISEDDSRMRPVCK